MYASLGIVCKFPINITIPNNIVNDMLKNHINLFILLNVFRALRTLCVYSVTEAEA